MLYLLSRVGGAQDLATGIELKQSLLGQLASLELHHIFPKARLRKHGYGRSERNALANFCFLTKESNLAIGMREPTDYLPEKNAAHPDALASQWIPNDPDLWEYDNYPKFLERRRELLARAANELLDRLRAGSESLAEGRPVTAAVTVAEDEPELTELVAFVRELGLCCS
jgi:hypothetical protein